MLNQYDPNSNKSIIQNSRVGRTSSTTTVFQKLDSRSHLTAQKCQQNEEEDQYMVLLSGGEENVSALLLDREQAALDGSESLTRHREQINHDEFSGEVSVARA